MMEKVCPICGGKKTALPPRHYNQVHWGDGQYKEETCWWCKGEGTVCTEAVNGNMMFNKYWTKGADYASEG